MKIVDTKIQDVKIIEPVVFGDERGFFMETWKAEQFAASNLAIDFVQDNHSRSTKNVLRGLHYQLKQPQGKLVRVVIGSVFDVAVDLRRSSETFSKWVGVVLSAENKRMLWVPPGFAHGFLTLSDSADFLYKCSGAYAPDDEHCILWNDKNIGIDWPLDGIIPTLSAKDENGKTLSDALVYS